MSPRSECQACGGKTNVSARCALCLQCRLKAGNPFLPAKELLTWSMLKVGGATNVLDVDVARAVELRTGRPATGVMVEVRCLRVDAPEWRYELGHSWPSGISLFVDDQRVLVKKPDEEMDSCPPGPFDLASRIARAPLEVNPRPLKLSAAITAKRSEQWALGVCLVDAVRSDAQIAAQVVEKQAPVTDRTRLDLERIFAWVTAHRPDRVSKKDTLRNVEPPVMKLVCCTSLSRIQTAARGIECDHLQCFDLSSYIHTMRHIPPKHAWCCPICDRPAPLHQLRLDAFAQSVIDSTEANVTEVLVADSGRWEVSATEDADDDLESSDDEAAMQALFPTRPTQADLQHAAMNLGRAFSAPVAAPARAPAPSPPVAAAGRDRSRSRGRRGRGRREADDGNASPPAADPGVDKMQIWEKLQGLRPPSPEPSPPAAELSPVRAPEKKEETRFGWLPDGSRCSRCEKSVMAKGGVFCGRKRPNGEVAGCFQEICWKCMNKASKDEIGGIKTSKTEFSSIGPDAWWMHEKCMSVEDKRAYFGEEDDDEDVGKPKDAEDSEDDHPGKFAWE